MNATILPFAEADISTQEVADFYLSVQQGVEADGQKKFVDIREGWNELVHLDDVFVEPGNFWVAQKQFQLVGCIGLRHLEANLGLLGRFGVDRSERRQGIGSALVSTLIAWARQQNFTELMLTTQPTQDGMPIYKRAGFAETEEFDEYDGDAIMRIRL